MGQQIKICSQKESDINNTINSCCPERAFLRAISQYQKGSRDYYFQYDSDHAIDRHLDIGNYYAGYALFSGEEMINTTQMFPLNDKEKIINELNQLDKNLVYIVRTGYQMGAGHFHSFFYDAHKQSWMLDGNNKEPKQLQIDGQWDLEQLEDCNFISNLDNRELTFYPIINNEDFLNYFYRCIADGRMAKDDEDIEKYERLWQTRAEQPIPYTEAKSQHRIIPQTSREEDAAPLCSENIQLQEMQQDDLRNVNLVQIIEAFGQDPDLELSDMEKDKLAFYALLHCFKHIMQHHATLKEVPVKMAQSCDPRSLELFSKKITSWCERLKTRKDMESTLHTIEETQEAILQLTSIKDPNTFVQQVKKIIGSPITELTAHENHENNVRLEAPIKHHHPKGLLSNISMPVLAGFITVLGVTAVAVSLVMMNFVAVGAIGLGIAGLGIANSLIKVGLFSNKSTNQNLDGAVDEFKPNLSN